MNRKKAKWIILFIFITAVLLSIPSAAKEDHQNNTEQLFSESAGDEQIMFSYSDSDELLLQYMNLRIGSGEDDLELFSSYNGNKLTGILARAYSSAKTMAANVATGNLTTARMTISFDTEELAGYRWSAADLEVGELDSASRKKAINQLLTPVVTSLYYDSPYEMFWYSGKWGWNADYTFSIDQEEGIMVFKTLELSLYLGVSQDYLAGNAENIYTADQAKILSVSSAITKASAIITNAKDMNDTQKLEYYRQQICSLNTYNSAAAESYSAAGSSYTGSMNPWTIIYLFDGDPGTNVVCEGYAKGFQYLCDSTQFDGQVNVFCVNGYMDNKYSAKHMWNIVSLNGTRYMVDLTNTDLGYNLFMVQPQSGSVDNGYLFYDGKVYILYEYESSDRQIYSDSELTIPVLGTYYKNGFNYINGEWKYYQNQQLQSALTGLVRGTLKQADGNYVSTEYYIQNGIFTGATGVSRVADDTDDSWYYVKDGVYSSSTGIAVRADQSSSAYYYVYKGKVTADAGWVYLDEHYYYVAGQGIVSTGWKQIGKKWYYFDKTGIMQTGWLNSSGKWYYLKSGGSMATGWIKYDGQWYFLQDSGVVKVGWLNWNGAWYYLKNNGTMATGWVQSGGQWYYLQDSGTVKNGWLKYKDAWYFLNSDGTMATGWIQNGGKWYFLKETGVMQTGWKKSGDKWYYLGDNGAVKTGWVKSGDKWYYLDDSGVMQTGYVVINGAEYYFDKSGAWQG